MSSFNLLSVGSQAVKTNQAALAVVGQNISNVNTEGYSRQIVNLNSTDPSGVHVESVQRVTDGFLTQQFWGDTSSFHRIDTYTDYSLELDNIFGDSSTSITNGIDLFFKNLQNAVDDPTSSANRELFITESEALVTRFNSMYETVNRQNDNINYQLADATDQINTYAAAIAQLNHEITIANAQKDPANELRDHRDQAVAKLSELIDIQIAEPNGESLSIFVASGQPLVIGNDANKLVTEVGNPDGTQHDVVIQLAGASINITDQIAGGRIGGMLDYRNEILNPSINELGRIALTLAESFNTVHEQGITPDNKLGTGLFADPNSSTQQAARVTAFSDNSRSNVSYANVEITDTTKLSTDEYVLKFTGGGTFEIRNLTTGAVKTQDDFQQVVTGRSDVEDGQYYVSNPLDGTLTFEMDGFKFDFKASTQQTAGEQFLIQPTRYGAKDIAVEMKDPNKLALASPVRVTPSVDNSGTAVATVNVTNIKHGAFSDIERNGVLTPPLKIEFSEDASGNTSYTVFNITDPNNPVEFDAGFGLLKDLPFTPGQTLNLGGYEVKIDKVPAAGDSFTFVFNKDGVSDNRNAIALSDLQKADLLPEGSYQDVYSSLVESVASKTAVAKINVEAKSSVLTATKDSIASLSGVNLDEEAARLVQFQQAYQAAAQLISVSQELFDTMLAIR